MQVFYVKSLTGGVSCGLGHEASTVHVARPRTVLDIRKALLGRAQQFDASAVQLVRARVAERQVEGFGFLLQSMVTKQVK